jgi:alkylated DNA repair dioxygenase AlkB
MDLFNEIRTIAMADATAVYHPAPDLGLHPDEIFTRLRAEIPWEQHSVCIHGRIIPQPRLSSWHGEVVHSYSTLAHDLIPHPWAGTVALLHKRVEALCGARFNSMLANLYRDGQDAIGWHADDEPELGTAPLIASLSFGAARRFDMRRKDDHAQLARITLEHGGLLIMGGAMQQHWQHAIARTTRPIGERINLTFRLTSG